ncbi:hypothetical protein GYB57_14645 [bacterium]|nr:hypothetical protein [bacterium]
MITTIALMFALVLDRKATPYFIGFWLISAIYEAFQNNEYPFKQNLKWCIIIASMFVLYTVGFLFSDFSREASAALEIKLSFLVFPLGFFLRRKPISTKEIKIALLAFQLACLISALYLAAQLIPAILKNSNLITTESFTYAVRTFTEKTLGVHSTYLSIFYLFSIYIELKGYGLKIILTDKRLRKKIQAIQLLLLTIIVLLLVARAPIIAFFVGVIVVETLKNWKRGTLILLSCLSIFLAAIFFIPGVGNRFEEAINSHEITESESSVNSSNLRRSILVCSQKLVSDNWLKGVGLDRIQNSLNDCYDSFNNKELSETRYNTHNQYFDILLGLGILGLFAFIIILIYPAQQLSQPRFELLLFFKLFIAICLLTENLLNRQHGVVFFVFFTCLFISHYLWIGNQNKLE